MGTGDPPLGRERAVRLPRLARGVGRCGRASEGLARAARVRLGGRPRVDPDHPRWSRVRRGRARGDAGARRGSGGASDARDPRLSAGVVLVADRDRPDRVCPLSATRAALGRGSEPGGSRLTEVHRMDDHEGMQLRALAAAVRERRLSAHELVSESLRRIEARDPDLAAVVALRTDEALEDARGLDAAITGGAEAGALAGLPLLVK